MKDRIPNHRRRWATIDRLEQTAYRLLVPRSEQEIAQEKLSIFTGEALHFLDSSPNVLTPLSPTGLQTATYYQLMEAVENGQMRPTTTDGKYSRVYRRPQLVQKYQIGNPVALRDVHINSDISAQLGDMFSGKSVTFMAYWDIHRDRPFRFSFNGRNGLNNSGILEFLPLPRKATEENVLAFHDCPDPEQISVSVFGDGERVDITESGRVGRAETTNTTQYRLVGSFHGETSGREYWLYGSNRDRDFRSTTREVASASVFAANTIQRL